MDIKFVEDKTMKLYKVSDVRKTIKIPNFDYKIFQEITGITKKMITKRLGEEE